MGRSVTVGRRTQAATALPPAPVIYETPAVTDEDAVREVYEDVLALAAEPLSASGPLDVPVPLADGSLPPARLHARVGRVGPTQHQIRDRELTVMTDALSVVRDITSVLERGSTPAVAAHEQALQLAQQQSREAFELARAAVTRESPMPDIHMHMPEHRVDVNVERSEIHVPAAEQHFHAGETVVNVPQAAAPTVDVFVPRQEPTVVHVAPAAAEVVVNMPEMPAAVAPSPDPTMGVRVEYDGEGNKVFVPVKIESEAS